ncbi:TadE/TadG family type IV pilus assembly protein [Roseovarius sp.]|jgi:Flp pilus assembly protein TadG|uniref:TadE/TadG family type IV pilus assembly protein n=1 Tax=Roseovarius sp. TaxID=1486281 RepID=UPI002622AAC3|nr:TadE/TadG family type IV pilus assembly protein [Roseovarius sp.]MDM8165107.1 pilus assembly protein [Roseovarius sp.]
MIGPFGYELRRFLRDEGGNASVEFVLVFPAYLALMLMSIELGFVTLRHTLLERGLDIAVREIRLGTGTAPQHDEIKDIICDNALMIRDCATTLRLEMRSADIRVFNSLDTTADCTDSAEPTKPVKQFVNGQQNQLMLLRACLRFDPLFPDDALGSALTKDANGQSSIVSMTAFVQEPL